MPRTPVPHGSIVVGLDSSPTGVAALEWAVQEASRRNLPLHLLHAYFHELWLAAPPERPEALARTDEVVEAAVARVRSLDSELRLTWDVPLGSAAGELVAASEHADTVVVGARGRGAVAGVLLGTVSLTVAMHAHCPVVVVHGGATEDGPQAGRVVVGIDGSEASAAAIGHAFAQASSRSTGLTAVHCWWLQISEGEIAGTAEAQGPADVAESGRLLLAESLAGWREKYPDVDVRELVLQEFPVESLIAQSAGAALMVVGSRGKGGFTGLMLGSVSQGVLRGAHCPVAVVRPTA